jgi:hypothetical protein
MLHVAGLTDLLALSRIACEVNAGSAPGPLLNELTHISLNSPDHRHRLRACIVLAALGNIHLGDSFFSEIESVLRTARAAAAPQHLSRYDLLIAQILYFQRRIEEGEAILKAQVECVSADGPSLHRYNLLMGMGTMHVARGDYRGAVAWTSEAAAIARKAGAPAKEAAALANLSVCQHRLGDPAAASAAASAAIGYASVLPGDIALRISQGVLLACFAIRGDTAAFEQAFAIAKRSLPPESHTRVTNTLHIWMSDALVLMGRIDEGVATILPVLKSFDGSSRGEMGAITRWAWIAREVLSQNHFESIVLQAAASIERTDLLDRLEIAQVVLAAGLLSPDDRSRFTSTAHKAMQQLPEQVLKQLGRLGLPFAIERALAQDSHPAA